VSTPFAGRALDSLGTLPVSVDDLSLARLREQPAADTPLARAVQQTALAWHLRQRDTAAALELAELAWKQLPPESTAVRARLQLVRAEAAWLAAQLALAEQLAHQSAAAFAAAQDTRGHSDAHAVLGHVLFDQGDLAAARQSMQQARQLAQAAGDTSRDQGAQAVLAYWSLVDDNEAAEAQWLPVAEGLRSSADPRVAMWANDFFGQLHARHGRHSAAITAFTAASERARDAGQVRRQVVACTNVSVSYSNLNDHDSAMEWTDCALALARPAGWPASIGLCLMMTGNSLYLLGRLQAAREVLQEAMAVLQPLPGSRLLLVARNYMIDVLLDLGEAAQATALAEETLALARTAGMDQLACDIQRALAKALVQQGRKAEAAAAAEEALQFAEGLETSTRVIDALLVLAEVHAPPPAQDAPEAPAHAPARRSLPHLQRALSIGAAIEGFRTTPDIFEAAARELALLGDLEQAYALLCQANAARDRESALAASHRAQALEVQRETQRLQAEAAALREEAAAAVHHAEALQSANDTLQQLGAVGREITAQRDLGGIFERVVEHLQGALELQHLSIWLLDDTATHLQLRFGQEQGQRLAAESVPLHSPGARVAHCARLGQELLAELSDAPLADDDPAMRWPGSLPARTALFGPLRVARRLVGVLCIQSTRPQAYGERERLVFRSVCAWAAIALDNEAVVGQLDAALHRLQQANDAERQAREQAELAMQLKGEFLANISHDLRTPLASLQGYLETLLLNPGQVSEADRARYLSTALAQSAKVNRLAAELMDLAQLESGMMQPEFARFKLRDLLVDVVRKLELAAGRRSQRMLLSLPPELPDAWADPGMIERVLTNLMDNAIQHAPQGSEIRVEVRAQVGQLQFSVLDTGGGIPIELRGGLFSRPSPVAQAHRPGGGGLGLLIVQRLLQQHGCEIRLVERAGFGAAFEFGVPGWRG
jgi:signal transduction histidine kinase/tetratricopeptide (TPR) repeat protein